MSSSTSHKPRRSGHQRGAHGSSGGGSGGGDGGGGGGGGDDLVKVAFARTQPEAEMLQGLLAEAGIPSVLKRSRGFDNPDFFASGPHDVMVHAGSVPAARKVLSETMLESEDEERLELEEQRRLARGEAGGNSPAVLAFWVVAALLAALVLVWIVYQVS
jgi:hypothetical protein